MFTQSKIAAVALLSTLAVSSSVQAEEVSLERYVTAMVNQAMVVAKQELNNNVRSAVLTAATNVSFNEEKAYVAKVTIKDIDTTVEADNTEAE